MSNIMLRLNIVICSSLYIYFLYICRWMMYSSKILYEITGSPFLPLVLNAVGYYYGYDDWMARWI